MNNLFEWLHIENTERSEKELKNTDPQEWFYKWLKILASILIIGGLWVFVLDAFLL